MLYELKHPSRETIFENCTADVNIPVGEVFTSPKLMGTEGELHVTKVYLNQLEYIDLSLNFQDGKISSYSCKNFETEEENKRFIKENLMYNQDTLPIGEFAIGTNTTAYVMAQKYNIADKLPILIAEKTGPHFAVGDTCYKMSEDLKRYNPDGKEIVAKDNEISILRKANMDQAYFNCHTDITIPYDELGEIIVYKKNGETITIIQDGRFILPGTEKLNEAFH
jgi:leucyl aminopeptidase (aminopeptidase T)